MVAWEIKQMGGVIPRTDARLVPDNMATQAANCDLTGGQLVGLPQVELQVDLSSQLPVVEKAYRFPPQGTNPEMWLPLPSRYSSAVRSPVVNDSFERIYWTNPGDISPHFTTYAGLSTHQVWDLGMVQPATGPVISSVVGGTTDPNVVLPEERSYVYTYVNVFNEESSPSPASATVTGPPDATWNISGLPTSFPPNPSGRNYPAINRFNLYRTIVSQTSGAQFYLVAVFSTPLAGGTYADTIPSSTVAEQDILESTGWGNPPDYLDGLTSMPGGFMVGFVGNTVYFSEPNRPHTWPDVYEQSAHYNIVALAVWQQYLVVLTQGFPLTGSGNMPSNIVLVQTQVAEPCISRGSVVVDTIGVFYASQNGLIQLTGYGIQNITAMIFSKNNWIDYYLAESLISARHRSQYMAINGSTRGFLIDYAETRLGVQDLTTLKDVVCVWNDEHTGDTLVCAGGVIYEWDCPHTPPQVYRWRSKQFFTPMPISLGAAQVELDPQIYDTAPPQEPLDNGDPAMQLPAGVNAVFRYYAGPKLDLIMTRNLTRQMEIFRLPSGFKAFDHQVEVLSWVPISSIQLADTLEELKKA